MIGTDGVVTLRAPAPGDVEQLVAGRDEEFFRWFGPGAAGPRPVACVWVEEQLGALADRLQFEQRGEGNGSPSSPAASVRLSAWRQSRKS